MFPTVGCTSLERRICEFRWLLASLLLAPLLFMETFVGLSPSVGYTVGLLDLPGSDELQVESPEFALCSLHLPCTTGIPSSEPLRYAGIHAREAAARSHWPVLLHIGDVGTSVFAWSTSLDLFSKALAPLPQEVLDVVRLVFVEPSSDRAQLIRDNSVRLPVDPSRVQVFSGVLKRDCETGLPVRLFCLSSQAELDFGVGFAVYGSWRGTNKIEFLGAVVVYALSTNATPWHKLIQAANFSDYVKEVEVPCYDPVRLLKFANHTYASSVSLVVVDGVQADLVEHLLDLPLFQPGYLRFHQPRWNRSATAALLAKLKKRGFAVGGTPRGEALGIAVSPRGLLPLTTPTEPPVVPVEPQFSACGVPQPCGPDSSAWRSLDDLLRVPGLVAREVGARGGVPVAMHIGSNNLCHDADFIDVDLHSRAVRSLPPALRSLLHLVLVDANAEFSTLAVTRTKLVPIGSGRAHFVNGMVYHECPSEHADMYRFSRSAVSDFGVDLQVMQTWMGPHEQYLLNVIKGFAGGPEGAKNPKWRAMSNAANLSSYIQKVKVPCLTVAALMDKLRLAISNLVYVIVDAETVDHLIVGSMLEWPGFKPGYLQYEFGDWNSNENQVIVRKLQSRGFMVGRMYTKDFGENNAIAVPFNASLVHLRPSFSVCDRAEACGPSNVLWRHLPALVSTVRSRAVQIGSRNLQPVFLQIGGGRLARGEGPLSPMLLQRRALGLLPSQLRESVRLLVVDPNEFFQHLIWSRMPFELNRAQYIAAEVLAECSSRSLAKYRISRGIAKDFKVTSDEPNNWLTKKRWGALDVALKYAVSRFPVQAPDMNEWNAFFSAWNRSAYVDEVTVPCLNISAAFSVAGIAHDNLAMVVIDSTWLAESDVRQLVSSMLESTRFTPGFLQFDLARWDAWENQVLLKKLRDRGFAVGRHHDAKGEPTHGIVAIREP